MIDANFTVADLKSLIGSKFREVRNAKGLNQEQMADLLEIKQCTYSGYETKKRLPSFQTLVTFVLIFDLSLDEFLIDPIKVTSIKERPKR